MSNEADAVGDVLTGAAIARAVDHPASGHATMNDACLNCGTALAGPYCHRCGQPGEVHRSIADLWHNFTHAVLHLDGKVLRTLPMLAFRPGQLTRRYIAGERAKFVSPLALFLFSVFLMFAVFSLVGPPVDTGGNGMSTEAPVAAVEIAKGIREAEAELALLQSRRDAAIKAGRPTLGIDGEISGVESEINGLRIGQRFAKQGGTLPAEAITVDTGSRQLDERIRSILKNPQLLFYKMQSNAYKFSWALVLLSIPFVWLCLAWKPGLHVYDHAIFVTYSQSFVGLLLVTLALVTALGGGWLSEALIVLAPPVHLFVQLRGAYGLSVGSALWRTVYLLAVALFVLLAFGVLLFAVGAGG